MSAKIWKIVLTGGPCSGKTTALTTIYEKFSQHVNVICVPETATMTFRAGVRINPSSYTFEQLIVFTRELVKMQVGIEDYFESLARLSNQPTLIVCDRGAVDTFAYCSAEVRSRVLQDAGWDMDFLCNRRYDLVIHLVTCANGASAFYNLNNNEARFESVEEAVRIDGRIRKVWMGHPAFTIIDNSGASFTNKLERALSCAGHFVNIPEKKSVKKFLLKTFVTANDVPAELHALSFTERIIFLKRHDEGRFDYIVRKRFQNSNNELFLYRARYLADKEESRVEVSRKIDKELFRNFAQQKDPETRELLRATHTFVWDDGHANVRMYAVESYELGGKRFSFLRADDQLAAHGGQLKVFDVEREVTGEVSRGP